MDKKEETIGQIVWLTKQRDIVAELMSNYDTSKTLEEIWNEILAEKHKLWEELKNM